MEHRDESYKKELMHLSADFFQRESNHTSLITITNCVMSPNHKYATLLISVLPESQEGQAVEFMMRRKDDLRDYLKKNFRTKIIPYVTVEIDHGEKNRQAIDQALKTQ